MNMKIAGRQFESIPESPRLLCLPAEVPEALGLSPPGVVCLSEARLRALFTDIAECSPSLGVRCLGGRVSYSLFPALASGQGRRPPPPSSLLSSYIFQSGQRQGWTRATEGQARLVGT